MSLQICCPCRSQKLFYRAYRVPAGATSRSTVVFHHGYGAHSGIYEEGMSGWIGKAAVLDYRPACTPEAVLAPALCWAVEQPEYSLHCDIQGVCAGHGMTVQISGSCRRQGSRCLHLTRTALGDQDRWTPAVAPTSPLWITWLTMSTAS